MLKKKENGYCIFNKNGLCTIHDFKPLICKIYPFDLDNGKIIQRKKSLCQKKWGYNQEYISDVIEEYWQDVKEYERKVLKWNKSHGRSIEEFIEEYI